MAKKIQTSDIAKFSKLSILDGTKAYQQLCNEAVKSGILDRSYGYYGTLFVVILAGFFFSAYQLYIQTTPSVLIFWGILYAFFTVQLGGFIHDAGHRAIFKSTKMNDLWGQIFAALIAMGYDEWKIGHNKHHAHPNQEGKDPDIELPFSFTKDRYKRKKGLIGFIRKNQAFLYFPIGSFTWLFSRITGVNYFIREFEWKMTWKILLFAAGIFYWFVLPFLVFDLSKALLLLAVVNPAIGLYMFNIFAPNHKGMPQLGKQVKLSFMEHQILTSRNIYGNWLTDFVYMGLNYQIEHHLFPNTPRNKLKLITPYILAFCRKKNIEFTQVSILETNKIILSQMYQISSSL